MLGLDIEVKKDDIVAVMGDLYVKNRRALKRLFKTLKKTGYEIENLREAEYRKRDGVTIEQMEQKGWSLWFAKLPNIRYGKCRSCNSLINTHGIESHGHCCEVCGEVTYYKIIDGSTIRFKFLGDRYSGVILAPQLSMKAKRWDTDEGYLYLYYGFLESGGLCVVHGEQAETYLNENKGMWEIIEENDQKLLKVKYPEPWDRKVAAIEPYEIWGHHRNFDIVKLWKGQEYDEYDHLPVPETISIHESWHWAPISTSPTIHARIMSACYQVSDKGYYYQDGRQFFQDSIMIQFETFIRHFTELNADAFAAAWPGFRKSGPGFIDDFAAWCHEAPIIEDQPNMMNTIMAVHDITEGKILSKREIEAAAKGAKDPNADLMMDMLSEMSLEAKKINRQRKAPLN